MISSILSSPRRLRRVAAFIWHLVGIFLALAGAFLLRFDFQIPEHQVGNLINALPLAVIVYSLVLAVFGLYRGLWSYFSYQDCLRYVLALGVGALCFAATYYAISGFSLAGFPRSVFLLQPLLALGWEIGGRMIVRLVHQRKERREFGASDGITANVLLVGSVSSSDQVIRSVRSDSGQIGQIIGVVADDVGRDKSTLHGVKVFGSLSELREVVNKKLPDTILILPPYENPRAMRRIVESCADLDASPNFRVIPALGDLASGKLDVSSIRKVEIEDLLQRKPNAFDRKPVLNQIGGRRVVVTGAGGSIGSEICRQVAATKPGALVLMDHSEFSLFEIEREIVARFPDLEIHAITGDVKKIDHLQRAMRISGGVDVVYHAAAYKHVHLMEKNVPASFENNVLGSRRCAEVASQEGATDFILVSTDKAVRPTSIMGATKRLAERAVLEQESSGTRYVAVRFGNVLGSSGSVIPIFKKQIESGGPVTVTTENTRRFFMTIPEAVELVLMAGAVAEDRSVMVLEMGEQVKIVDLARRLIELSGFKPGEDIAIEFIGLRPGEKEYEELLTEDEDVVETEFEKIWMMRRSDSPRDPLDLERIEELAKTDQPEALRQLASESIGENYLLDTSESLNKTPAVV